MSKIKHAAPSVVTNEKQNLCRSDYKGIKGVTLVLNLKVLNRKKGSYLSVGELNPGHPRDRRVYYHYTNKDS